jgi:hypothetical protein
MRTIVEYIDVHRETIAVHVATHLILEECGIDCNLLFHVTGSVRHGEEPLQGKSSLGWGICCLR